MDSARKGYYASAGFRLGYAPLESDTAERRRPGKAHPDHGETARTLHMRRSRRAWHRRVAVLVTAILSVILLIGILAGGYRTLFVVKQISVAGAVRYTESEILASCGLPENVKLYSFRSGELKRNIAASCPYVLSVQVIRRAPDQVELVIQETQADFAVEIYGKWYAVDRNLRLLGELSREEKDALPFVELPGIEKAVAGKQIEMGDSNAAPVILTVLKAVAESNMKERISKLDLRDIYHITGNCDGKYRLVFGNSADMATKLRIAESVLRDSLFESGNKALIDLSSTSETSVIIDNQLEL